MGHRGLAILSTGTVSDRKLHHVHRRTEEKKHTVIITYYMSCVDELSHSK